MQCIKFVNTASMQNQLKQIYFIVRFGNGRYVSMKVVTEIQKTILNKFITPSGINSSNMNTEKLERANILAKSLIPKVNELLNMSPKSMRSSLADAICGLSECDEEFKTKFKQLLNETKQRFQKEFDEI